MLHPFLGKQEFRQKVFNQLHYLGRSPLLGVCVNFFPWLQGSTLYERGPSTCTAPQSPPFTPNSSSETLKSIPDLDVHCTFPPKIPPMPACLLGLLPCPSTDFFSTVLFKFLPCFLSVVSIQADPALTSVTILAAGCCFL